MKTCNNCTENKILYSETINTCPECGSILEFINKNDEVDCINIQIDFTGLECDCGERYSYEAEKCPKCGDKNERYNNMDLRVKLRKERFAEVLNWIEELDLELKKLQLDIKKGIIQNTKVENSREFIQVKIEKLSVLSDENIFRNIRFHSNELKSQDTNIKIQKIKNYIKSLYDLQKDLISNEVAYTWKNIFFRLKHILKEYIDVNKLIIDCILANNYTESKKIMKSAQNKLNYAGEDLTVLSDMIQIKNLEENTNRELSLFDLMNIGKFCDFKDDYIENDFIMIQSNTFNYFKEFLNNDIDYYKYLPFKILSNLSSYKVIAITSFSESRFKFKVRNVIKVLELAQSTDLELLKSVMNEFKLTYLYALNTINDVTQIDDLNLKYYKNERLLIRNTMRSYKDFIEGVYRDIMSVIVASSYIIDGKNVKYQEIKSLNFGDKLNYIETKKPKKKNKNLNLCILSGGINKEFRHAEAHVDYEIDNKNKTILLRNKKESSPNNIEKKHSFEDFYMLYTELKETIYSIIIGLEIFIANNYEDFSDFITYVNNQIVNDYEGYIFELYFDSMSIKQIEVNKYKDGDTNILHIKGISKKYSNIEILESCIQSIVGDVDKSIDKNIDIVNIELFDNNNKKIGSTHMNIKYLRVYFELEENLKTYQMLLYIFTSEINYEYEDYNKDDKICTYLMDFIFKTLDKFLNSIDNKSSIELIEELKYIIYVFDEYEKNTSDKCKSMILRMKLIINNIINTTVGLYNYDKKNEYKRIQYIHKEIDDIYKIVIGSTDEKQEHQKIKVGRNEPCPCRSGKKFKKCCGK